MIVTKLGGRRPPDKSWQPAVSPRRLIQGVHDNLRNLGLDALDIVNYRHGRGPGPEEGSIAEKVEVLADLQRQGLIRHIGLSNVTAAQVAEAQGITDIVCVQNHYNLAHRHDDALIDDLDRQGIAYVPFFPLGGFTPLSRPPFGRRRPPRGHADAGRAGMADAPVAQHPADPRNVVARPPPREPCRRSVDPVDGIPGGVGRDRRRCKALISQSRAHMPPDAPLTRDRILAAAEDVIRRFGPAKATVVDVARALGVSHTAVYKHVSSKAELRDLVVGQWLEATMPPLRAIVAWPDPAPQRLRKLVDALIAVKRRRAADDPELFAAYMTLAADAKSVVAAHIAEMVGLTSQVIASGVKERAFRTVDPVAAGRAVLFATSKFHHPAHAAEWADPAIDAAYNDVWQLLMYGLCPVRAAQPPRFS